VIYRICDVELDNLLRKLHTYESAKLEEEPLPDILDKSINFVGKQNFVYDDENGNETKLRDTSSKTWFYIQL
jgi:hypothetical protein